MANTVDRNALLDELKKIQGELDNNNLGEIAATAKKLAGEEDLLNLDSDPAIAAWQPTSRPGGGPGGGPGGVVKIPTLPAKTILDLSKPTVNVPNVPEFKIPDMLSVTANSTAVTHPGNLTQGDWLIIARNKRILYAYTMGVPDEVDVKKNEPPQAKKAALDWLVPNSMDFMVSLEDRAQVTSEVIYTDETASYVQAGFDKQQASVGFPFAAASFEREHKERQAGASYQKKLRMIGRWYYPRVQLNLKECATASERFKIAIRSALEAYDKRADIKDLLKVFQDYGTAVPSEVVLGGQLLFVHKEDYHGQVNESEVENVTSAAVNIKTTKAEGSVGASFQNAQGNKVTGDNVNKATDFTVNGGDSTLASNPPLWPASVKPASQWAVIGRSKLTSIVEWLPDDLRGRVLTLWPKVPLPPAIWEPQATLAQDHSATAKQAQFVLGAWSAPYGQDMARGEVQFACGTSMNPVLGRGDAAGGAASFHRNAEARIDVDAASVCLPVPAGHSYAATTWIETGSAATRFAIAETNLTLDKWRLVEAPQGMYSYRGFTAETDGFVFCSLEARNEGDRGNATCEVDKTLIAAASVHDNHGRGCCLQQASFCAPYAKGSHVEVRATTGYGQLSFSVWRIPSTSPAWKFTKPEALSPRSLVTADTDGFVNGVIAIPGGEAYVRLDLYCLEKADSPLVDPLAAAVAHFQYGNNNWISHSSAMLPVRERSLIYPDLKATSEALAQVYLTKVVPVM